MQTSKPENTQKKGDEFQKIIFRGLFLKRNYTEMSSSAEYSAMATEQSASIVVPTPKMEHPERPYEKFITLL